MKAIIIVLVTYLIGLCTCRIDINIDRHMKTETGQPLATPIREKCLNRPSDFSLNGHKYFYSYNHPEANQTLGWMGTRNICRRYCMELITIESQEENELILRKMEAHSIPYLWTSGRSCDFPECNGLPDMIPKKLKGWFWVSTMEQLPQTNQIAFRWSYNPWSKTGFFKQPQPDDAEYAINSTHESCLAILHNVYNDGIKWHDVACYHKKPFICEDSDELLKKYT